MRIMLLFPPHWTPALPHLALPTLTAHLRAHGVEVIQRDLNIETFDALLTREYLDEALARLRDDQSAVRRRALLAAAPPPHDKVEWALAEGPQLAVRVAAAKAVMRSDAFLDGPRGVRAYLDIAASLEIAALAFYPSAFDFWSAVSAAPVDSSRHLLELVRDPQRNLYHDLFQRRFVKDIVREHPDLVGISIATLGQMLAGMTLAFLIKHERPACHVTVGGPHITMLREELARLPALFELFDSAVLFEGETPLLRLAEALDAHAGLAAVPNLIHRDGDRIRVTEHVRPDVDLPPRLPDFDGLSLNRYLSPHPVLPLLTAHGCYHARCAFCSVGYGEPAVYRQLGAEVIVDQMLALNQKYGTRHIFFADEAISPRNLRDVSARLSAMSSPMHWCGCARFESALTGELLEQMARGGCRMLLYGLETASDPVIARIDKGTRAEEMGRILDEGAARGIWNHVFFFFGFPGETLEQAQETLNFVYAHQEAIHSASPGKFVLERYAPVYRTPERYGVRRIITRPEQDLAIYFDYEVESGMDEETAERAVTSFMDVLPEKRWGHLYTNDAYRFLYASHLHEQGEPLPPWLVPEAET